MSSGFFLHSFYYPGFPSLVFLIRCRGSEHCALGSLPLILINIQIRLKVSLDFCGIGMGTFFVLKQTAGRFTWRIF